MMMIEEINYDNDRIIGKKNHEKGEQQDENQQDKESEETYSSDEEYEDDDEYDSNKEGKENDKANDISYEETKVIIAQVSFWIVVISVAIYLMFFSSWIYITLFIGFFVQFYKKEHIDGLQQKQSVFVDFFMQVNQKDG